MKTSFLSLSVALAASATATPLINYSGMMKESLPKRQTGHTINEYLEGPCRDVIFFYARGTSADGSIGDSPGPQLVDLLKSTLGAGTVAAQGINYPAGWLDNLKSGGCPPESAAEMAQLLTNATTSCPTSKLLVSGFSQGAAMVHRSVEQLSETVMDQIAAAVTFGDSQNDQDDGRIPNFDTSKTLIICHEDDLVCEGIPFPWVGAHDNYEVEAPQAVEFMVSKLYTDGS